MKSFKEIERNYIRQQKLERAIISCEQNKLKRLGQWLLYLLIFPFKWLFYNLRDWRTIIVYVLVNVVVSSSVWVFYLLVIITGWNTTQSKWFLGIGTSVWAWWLSPIGSPYILICIFLTILVKEIFNKIRERKILKNDKH